MRQAGAPEEVIERAEREASEAADESFEVWPENWPTFLFFCALQTRWNWIVIPSAQGSAKTRRTGLNWPAVEIAIDYAIRRGDFAKRHRTALYDDVVTMELEALKVFSDQD